MNNLNKEVYGAEGREKMMEGIDKLANVVGSTMGAKGRNVLLGREHGAPQVINDGVSIAMELSFKDPLVNNAAQLIKDAAIKTNMEAGDGTTGATVLSRAIVKAGWESIQNGSNPVMLRKDLVTAANKVLKSLKENAIEIEEESKESQVVKIAQVSVQDKEIGSQIGKVMAKIGKDGAVLVKNSLEQGVFIENSGGTRIEGSVVAGTLDSQERWESRLEKPRILIMEDDLEEHEFVTKWVAFSRQFVDATPQGQVKNVHVPVLLVIAEKLPVKLIKMMNNNKDFIKWVWFRPSMAGKNKSEILKDLAATFQATVVKEEEGVYLNRSSLDILGRAASAICDRHSAVITIDDEGLQNDKLLDRINTVRSQVESAENETERQQIKDRLANITGGVAVLKVAAATNGDTEELKLRIEDAVNACRSAMEEGVVPGGGAALLHASKALDGKTDEGSIIMRKACRSTFHQILKNAGLEDDEITRLTKEVMASNQNTGVNILTMKKADMVDDGVIDPHKVIKQAMLNAVSVSGLLLTSEYSVITVDDELETIKQFFR